MTWYKTTGARPRVSGSASVATSTTLGELCVADVAFEKDSLKVNLRAGTVLGVPSLCSTDGISVASVESSSPRGAANG